jgi:drug/metabolite transporter (DMT)-like permease
LLALASAVSFSVSHFLVRLGLSESNPTTAVAVNVFVNALGLWVLTAFFSPIRPLFSFSVWPYVLGGLFAPSLARVLLYYGYNHMGLARAAVLGGTVPLFSVAVAVIFLGERPSPLMLVGTVSVVLGVGALSYARHPGKTWPRWAIIFPLGAAFGFAMRDIFSKVGLEMIPLALGGASVTSTTSVVVLYLSFLIRKERERIVLTARSFWLFFFSGVLLVGAYVSIFVALKLSMVSLVSPIVNVHPFISVLLSYLFLQSTERVNWRVVFGGILVVGGATTIMLG